MPSVVNRVYISVLCLAVIIFRIVSYANLTTWPTFWYDEGLAVEVAHNFSQFQVLDVSVAPGVFAPYATVIAGSSGYPLTVPLAAIFSIVGFSFFAARLYMLVWCIICIGILFFFLKRFFTTELATLSSLLILSFSSFFADGRTVTGEIPGFSFLLLGLWLFLTDQLFFAGLLFGLAAASKPSLYLLLFIPIVCDVCVWGVERKWMRLVQLGSGYAPPILLWFYLTLPKPLNIASIVSLISFYRNPFGSTSILGNILSNLVHVPVGSTTLYFLVLACTVGVGFYFLPTENKLQCRIFLFFSIIGAISFIYFLRSPGWLRYLLPLEFCTLILLPESLKGIFSRFSLRKNYSIGCIGALVVLQIYVLFFHSDIFRSATSEYIASYIDVHLGADRVGIINDPTIAALTPAGQRYDYISMTGVPTLGVDALSLPNSALPKFIVVSDANRSLIAGYESVLQRYYKPILPEEGNILFEHN